MESLEKIQKVSNVFRVLTKIAMIISIVGGCIALVAAPCAMVWKAGGQVIGLDYDVLFDLTKEFKWDDVIVRCFVGATFAFADAILFGTAYAYFNRELEDGTPFTEGGSKLLKKLGIKMIVVPIVALVIAEVICVCYGVDMPDTWGNEIPVSFGLMLILISMIFRYGAELEKK